MVEAAEGDRVVAAPQGHRVAPGAGRGLSWRRPRRGRGAAAPGGVAAERWRAEAGMEGAAGDPYRRPARRTQWLLSALAHHYGLDRGVENEIVVLATGLDQYLQEVFHHLDSRGVGRLPREDFRALCAVLGLRAEGPGGAGEAAGEPDAGDAASEEEARLALCAEPPELTFRQFHARLCGYFGTRAGPRLPRGALSEHIETQIRLRRPRRRRRAPRAGPDGPPDPDDERAARLEEENGSLRELVEDLRAALQSSDARCLALQVGLWKSQAGSLQAGPGGLEAARELQQAQGALAVAEAREGRLRRGHAEVRRRVEDARQALLCSLRHVRELEALAQQVPGLQLWVQQLEAELQRYRSEVTQRPTSPQACQAGDISSGEPEGSVARDPGPAPEKAAWPSDSSSGSSRPDEDEEQLFRSVEGQAASDEEDAKEEGWHEEQKPLAAEATKLMAGLLSCGKGCNWEPAKKQVTHLGHFGHAGHTHSLGELEAHLAMLVGTQAGSRKNLGPTEKEAELQRKMAENEHLRLELQMVETERVRLSLLEEKLVDTLQLLQRLRALSVSRRALGKILLSTLSTCRDHTHEGRTGPLATLDALHQALAGCKLLHRQSSAPVSTSPALTNSLLVSC
ncbi:EF-hand and coiled-coil domain-containing protein 1 [Tenrec ecaudatus]|uniref:EF-hand and coiled-coil domain-containing protein 1 n=1 Tax=Tenrec ecaudatus TaxID=94439 RepID=UPI003F59B59A